MNEAIANIQEAVFLVVSALTIVMIISAKMTNSL